jgi:hypothetical protein
VVSCAQNPASRNLSVAESAPFRMAPMVGFQPGSKILRNSPSSRGFLNRGLASPSHSKHTSRVPQGNGSPPSFLYAWSLLVVGSAQCLRYVWATKWSLLISQPLRR